MRLKDKIAVITGAGSGIGRAAAETFAREGAHVLILERDREAGEAVYADIQKEGGKAEFYELDVFDWESVQNVFAAIGERYGGIDVLYNNASVFWGERDAALDMAFFESVIKINLFATAYCTKMAIPLLKKRGGGAIINTSSSCGLIGIPNCDAYSSPKGATISLTRSLAVEYGPCNIRTNCISTDGDTHPHGVRERS